MHVFFSVLRALKHFLNATSDTLKFLNFASLEFLVNLEEDNLERWLSLDQVHDLEVLLIELGLGLIGKQLHLLSYLLVDHDDSSNCVEAEDPAEELLEGPNDLKEENEDSLCISSFESDFHLLIQGWWGLVATGHLEGLHEKLHQITSNKPVKSVWIIDSHMKDLVDH